jgi:hypothetical protein
MKMGEHASHMRKPQSRTIQKILCVSDIQRKHLKTTSRFINGCMNNQQFHNFHTVTLLTYLEYVDQSLLEPTTKALEQQSF